MRQVGQRGGLLLGAHLGDAVGRLFAEGRGAVEVLHQVRQQAQDVQREAYGTGKQDQQREEAVAISL